MIRLSSSFAALGLLFQLSVLATSPGRPDDSSVTVPIKDYLELKEKAEFPAVNSIEEVILRGVYGRNLSIEFIGSSSGKADRRAITAISDSFSFFNCKGDAYLDREAGNVVVVATAKRFRLNCQVGINNWNAVEIPLQNVLFFRSEVAGAQTIVDSNELGRTVSIVKENKETRTIATTVTSVARYQLTALPEETRFRYQLTITNPGRTLRDFEINWENNELIQDIRTSVAFDDHTEGITLKLRPGENEVVLTGKFANADFSPLLDSEQQYFLIESHPMLQLDVSTSAKRISTNNSGMTPQFANAKAYFFGGASTFQWKTKKLDLVESLGFAIQRASYRYYIPESGQDIVEANFTIENQGTPEIPLEIPGTATYLEINHHAEPLYRDTKGRLLVRLPAGQHEVLVQYRTPQDHRGFFTYLGTDLIRPPTVLSNVSVNFNLPEKWRVVFGSSLFRARSDFFSVGVFCLFAGCALLVALLRTTGISLKHGLFTGGCLFGLGFVIPSAPWLAFAGYFLALAYRHRAVIWDRLRQWPKVSLSAAVAVFGLAGLIMLAQIGRSPSPYSKASEDYDPTFTQLNRPVPMNAVRGKARDTSAPLSQESIGDAGVEETPSTENTAYVGMPARIPIPVAARHLAFRQEFVDKNGSISAHGLLISQSLLMALGLLCLCGLGYVGRQSRQALSAWVRN